MNELVLSLALLAGGGVAGFFFALAHRERLGAAVAALAAVLASALSLPLSLGVLMGGETVVFRAPWALPGAEVHLAIDRLAALFLLPIFGLGPLAAVYGAGYLNHYTGRKRLGPPILFFNLLLAALTTVVAARHAFLFIFAWELMTLFAFLLVSFEDEHEDVRRAAFLYVAISHVAAMFVFAFFLVIGRETGSLDLDVMAAGAPGRTGLGAGLLFIFALCGFGTKAGIAPLHVWLPRAHPVAPSHVSAVMSAVIVKTALYAFLRALTLLGPAPAWGGFTLVGLGVFSAAGGILLGALQSDLKRLLAYSTIENVGIMLIGLGTGLVGSAYGNATVAVLGITGALLHALYHVVMKGLLFLGAGAVLHATHARSVDRLGGLLARMPLTGAAFIAGALAIAAMPPFCGFASEWLVYAGLLRGGLELRPVPGAFLIAVIPALAITGGLAAAALAKGAGLAFLGAPRSEEAARAHEAPLAMRVPLVLLAVAAVVLGLAPVPIVRAVAPIAAALGHADAASAERLAAPALAPLAPVALAGAVLIACGVGLALLRRRLLATRAIVNGPTWGCGYPAPTARMQYTGASFARPLAQVVHGALAARVVDRPPEGYFPSRSFRETRFEDPAEEGIFAAAARRIEARMLSLRWMQQGRLQLYLLYILVAIVALLVWQVLVSGGTVS